MTVKDIDISMTELEIEQLNIPFKVSFSHSSATRSKMDSAFVTAKSNTYSGYGESCPRPYVTGETYDSVKLFFFDYKASVMENVTNLNTLKSWVTAHQAEIDQNPAAWCAIELAILDLLAKQADMTVETLLGLPELSGNFTYTAVLGDSSIKSFAVLAKQYHSLGFSDYKIKLSGEIKNDKEKCDLILGQNRRARIRLDANNLWQSSDQVVSYIKRLEQDFFAIEEPIQTGDYSGLECVAIELGIPIILDESFIRLGQFKYISDDCTKWVINLRVSKMGGILRSLTILNEARNLGIPCIVGAQVGETSILTRSALTLVNQYRDIVLAQEGACGTYLLERDISEPILMFADQGVLNIGQLSGLNDLGFGLTIANK